MYRHVLLKNVIAATKTYNNKFMPHFAQHDMASTPV